MQRYLFPQIREGAYDKNPFHWFFFSSTAFLLSCSIITSPEVQPSEASLRENSPKVKQPRGSELSKLHKASRKSQCNRDRATGQVSWKGIFVVSTFVWLFISSSCSCYKLHAGCLVSFIGQGGMTLGEEKGTFSQCQIEGWQILQSNVDVNTNRMSTRKSQE